ncbi:uncharacterized protein EV420DRAFT_1487736 [Desarmillaria tabescens]|uniref:Uncharacterized protein n=1 Tax=Armillaria tabescens TaxID=1929756 RepID=A0AA39J5X8_ARMTA|nr:uncharacterized protein EV420DRAFT_1487736 [Desarmillaria tabescens]KAK0435942.1 hypothetical protein EV420DRAFT_1487736 [Desarmillaria tabescens]
MSNNHPESSSARPFRSAGPYIAHITRTGMQEGFKNSPMFKILTDYNAEHNEVKNSTKYRVMYYSNFDLSPVDIQDLGFNRFADRPRYSLQPAMITAVSSTVMELQSFILSTASLLAERDIIYQIDPSQMFMNVLHGTNNIHLLNAATLEGYKDPSMRIYQSLHILPSQRQVLTNEGCATLDKGETRWEELIPPSIPLKKAFSSTNPERNPASSMRSRESSASSLRVSRSTQPGELGQVREEKKEKSELEAQDTKLIPTKTWVQTQKMASFKPLSIASSISMNIHTPFKSTAREFFNSPSTLASSLFKEFDLGGPSISTDFPRRLQGLGSKLPVVEEINSNDEEQEVDHLLRPQEFSIEESQESSVELGFSGGNQSKGKEKAVFVYPSTSNVPPSYNTFEWGASSSPKPRSAHISPVPSTISPVASPSKLPTNPGSSSDSEDDSSSKRSKGNNAYSHHSRSNVSIVGILRTMVQKTTKMKGEGEGENEDTEVIQENRVVRENKESKEGQDLEDEEEIMDLPGLLVLLVRHLAGLGGWMPEYLGQWLWRGLKEDSEIYAWFSTLTPEDQDYMRLNRGFEMESPQAFIMRRTVYTCMLTQINDGGLQEITIVMRKAPIAWQPILNMSTIQTSKQLLARVIEHSKALVLAARSDGGTSRIQTGELITALKSLGIDAPKRPRFLPSWSVNLVEEEEDLRTDLLGEMESSKVTAYEEDFHENNLSELLLKSALQILKKRQCPPPKQYYFPMSDKETNLDCPPPSPCKVCRSPKHWDKECPYWEKYLERVKKRNAQLATLQLEDSASPQDMYQTAFQVLTSDQNYDLPLTQEMDSSNMQDFGMAAQNELKEGTEEVQALNSERKTDVLFIKEANLVIGKETQPPSTKIQKANKMEANKTWIVSGQDFHTSHPRLGR